ncbi:MAG: phenylalanine--tRNA ligase subunit beta [Gammaproteobacteria bacterium]
MKLSEQWLREIFEPHIERGQLIHQLNMAGLEVDEVTPILASNADLTQVVVGEVMTAKPHPANEQLTICQVNVNVKSHALLTIVCGAANVRCGLKVAVAKPGTRLPNGVVIAPNSIKGQLSEGMLCSAAELGIGETNERILELPVDAPIGTCLIDYMNLNDVVMDISITPNRGDALSVYGICREIAVLNNKQFQAPPIVPIKPTIDDQLPIALKYPAGCSHYVGRVMRNVDISVPTPLWMLERLRRSGIRSINIIVDITNYVMLELGQPMHAFDLHTIHTGIYVRLAKNGESLTLLNEQAIDLLKDTLVIADKYKPIAIAGVMGGLATSVTANTTDIFLESAFFVPRKVIGKARKYGLHTDSAYRFERGVAPDLQRAAIERATRLIMDIAGGQAGPVSEVYDEQYLPKQDWILLRLSKIYKLLGLEIPESQIIDILTLLGCEVCNSGVSFEVKPPNYRFDLRIEEDLIEEIARIYGYEKLPKCSLRGELQLTENHRERCMRPGPIPLIQCLANRGYHEAITYSFVDPKLQELFDPDEVYLTLLNPISADLSQMRRSLWPGLVKAVLHNMNHQQSRVRLCEVGMCFALDNSNKPVRDKHKLTNTIQLEALRQDTFIAGIATGSLYSEQWGSARCEVDFYDIKADVQALLAVIGNHMVRIVTTEHPALHPGQSAAICFNQQTYGYLGALHPAITQKLGLPQSTFVFEINMTLLRQATLTPQFQPLSKFPAIRRDLSFYVAQHITAEQLRLAAMEMGEPLLQDAFIFDVYRGKGVPENQKSLAMGLILQDSSRTLIEEDVNKIVNAVVNRLQQAFAIEMRD